MIPLSSLEREDLAKLRLFEEQATLILARVTLDIKDQVYERHCLLVAYGYRFVQQSKAVGLLATHDCTEELQAILRTMAEGLVNALYLQICSAIELDRFMRFDNLVAVRHLKKKAREAGDQALADKLQSEMDELCARLARKSSDLQWSEKSVRQRAELVDERLGQRLSHLLYDSANVNANFSVHGTFHSLVPFMPLSLRSFRDEERRAGVRALSVSFAQSVCEVMRRGLADAPEYSRNSLRVESV